MSQVGYSGPERPKMLMIGEAWGADEDAMKMPLVGMSGKEHWRMLGEALPDVYPDLHADAATEIAASQWGLAWIRRRDPWLSAAGIGFTNVFNCRPPNNDLLHFCGTKTEVGGSTYTLPALNKGKYLRPEYLHHIESLHQQVKQLKPNVCVLMGNTACWAMLGMTNITSLRGTTTWSDSAEVKCLPTFHPASLLYEGQWSRRPIIVADFLKAYRESAFPELRRPQRRITINPTLDEVTAWIGRAMYPRAEIPYLTIDCETSGGMIDTIGFATSWDEGFVIPFGPHRVKRGTNYVLIMPERDGQRVTSYWKPDEEVVVWEMVHKLLMSPVPKLFQNGMYDVQYIMKVLSIPNNCLHDTMLAWHALFPEMPKNLGFLGSILTNDIAWKRFRSARSDTEKRDE